MVCLSGRAFVPILTYQTAFEIVSEPDCRVKPDVKNFDEAPGSLM